MTKKEFMYITGFSDEEQLENIMLLGNDEEPKDGDWAELLKKWYINLQDGMNEYMEKYHTLSEDFRKMRELISRRIK